MRVVLFDVGNTLAHLDYAFLAGCSGVAVEAMAHADALVRRHGWPAEAGFFPGYFGAVAATLGLDAQAGRALATAAADEHRRRPGGLWNDVDPEAGAVLTRLAAAGLRLGVVSNADGRVEEQLRGFGLRQHFAVVVDSHTVGVAKPDPRIFGAALQAMGAVPGEALYLGDIYAVDVRGAQACGLAAALYDRWDAWPDAPCARIRRLGELPPLLGL